nr:biotin/lipoyl-binding protein [Pyrinomonadaceae bacterium]
MFVALLNITPKLNLLPPRRTVRRLIAYCLLLATTALWSTGCQSGYPVSANQNRPNDQRSQPKQVRTTRVTEMPMGQTVSVNGTLAVYDQATVSVKVPGRLRSITVDLGSPVRRGQMLAQLELQDYLLRIEQSSAALAQVRTR